MQSGSLPGDKAIGACEVKNAWSYTSTPPYVLISWWLTVQRDKRAFIFRGNKIMARKREQATLAEGSIVLHLPYAA
jgi:hypothetical protein